MIHLFEQLSERIEPSSRLLRVWQLSGGISAQMTALEIQHADGSIQKIIVRRPPESTLNHNPHAARAEFQLLQILHALGLPVAAPLYLDESRELFPTPYLVIEYIEGSVEFSPADRKDFAYQFAAQLAQIHRINLTNADLSFLPKSTGCPENLQREIASDMPFELEQVRNALQARAPFMPHNGLVLLHGDFWGGNVLWRDGKLVAVVDWENTELGDPLYDFAISRLDTLWIYGLEAFDTLTIDYQSLMPLDYTDLPYWDLCAAFRLLRMIGENLTVWVTFFHPYGRTDITEQTFRAHMQFFIQQALEKIS